MSALLRWVRGQLEEHQRLQEMKARETERRIQREQRDSQQAQALSLALSELQRSMDPLIAAQFYNNHFCPLSRLPEELLLHVLDFLTDDPVTLHCLQAVSRVFLRLLYRESDIWRDEWYVCPTPRRGARTGCLQSNFKVRFRSLLQRDGRCYDCMRWNDASVCRPTDDCKFEHSHRRRDYRKLYCGACDTKHDNCQFSKRSQKQWEFPRSRRCLGQEGSVQLCEHVQITWANITAHINEWQRQHRGGGDWKACLSSFNVECRDASHDTRCTELEAPTWPRACLRTRDATSFSSSDAVVLRLEWAPHSRIDSLALTADGRIPAHELRARFQRLRELGPADNLYPPSRPGALPELACISPSCPFIYYKTGQDDETPPPLAPCPSLPLDGWQLSRHCKSLRGDNGSRKNSRKLEIIPHYLKGAGNTGISSQCFVTRYVEDIKICTMTAIMDPPIKIIPTDHWLHSMDTETYSHPEGHHVRPQCWDETCVNYHRRRKACYFYV